MAQYRQPVQAVRYTSQFDPGMEQMAQQILLRKQDRYDTAFAFTNDEQAKLGSIFSLDDEVKQKVMANLEQNKQDILKRYNGDYGAASKDLANLVVKERSNPFYNLNALHQKQTAEYQQQVNSIGAENAIVLKAPSRSLMKDGKLIRPEDLDYDVRKRTDYDQKVSEAFQGIAKSVQEGKLHVSKEIEGYMQQYGYSGLALLNDAQLDELVAAYKPQFENETTFNVDPIFKDEKGNQKIDTKTFLKDSVKRLIPSGVQNNYSYDQERARRLNNEVNQPSNTPWLSKEDSSYTTETPKQELMNEHYFDESGKLKPNIDVASMRNVSMHGAEAPMTALNETYNKLDLSAQRKQIDDFRKSYAVPADISDKDVDKLMIASQNVIRNTFGTLYKVPETKDYSMQQITGNIFSSKDGYGDLANRRIWINGKELKKENRLEELKDLMGSDNKTFDEDLKKIGIAGLSFTGNSPVSIVGSVLDKKGNELRIEVSSDNEIQNTGRDMFNISKNFRTNNKEKFNLTYPINLRDNDTAQAYKASGASTDIEMITGTDGGLIPIPIVKLYDADGNILKNSRGEDIKLYENDFALFTENAKSQLKPYLNK